MKLKPFIIFFVLVSCENNFKTKPIVELYDKKLYRDEIMSDFPKNELDTSYFIENYIENWIKNNLLLYSAEINLSTKQKDLKKQTTKYYENLLIHKYQKKIVNQKIDTNISNNQILEYYLDNKESFKLNKVIVKVNFVVFLKNAPNQKKFKKSFFEKNDDYYILEYCNQFADKFYISDTNWIFFNDILSHLPEEIASQSQYILNLRNNIFEDDKRIYLIKIFDKMLPGELSPINIVKESIKSTIINENKLRYLNDLNNQLYIQAVSEEKIKINK